MSLENPINLNAEEQTPETPHEQESESFPSSEMVKLKCEMEKLNEQMVGLLFGLRNRADYGFTEFLDESEINRLSQIVVNIKGLDIYMDHDLEQTSRIFSDIYHCLDSIQMNSGRGGMNDDLDSLRTLISELGELSEQAGNIEFTIKQLNTDTALKLFELATRLKEVSYSKAQYIYERALALERYLR